MKIKDFAPGTMHLKNAFAILILAFVLSSEVLAQDHLYRLLIKGQPSPFDSAVAVRLDRYREETKKLSLGAELVDSLGEEIRGLRKETALRNEQEQNHINTISMLVKANNRKDSVNQQLKTYFNKLDEITAKDRKNNKFLLYGLYGLIAIEVIRLFTR